MSKRRLAIQNSFYKTGIVKWFEESGNKTLVSEKALAEVLGCNPTTIKRAVKRGELPYPTRLLGKPTWTVGSIVRHIESRLDQAKKEATILNVNMVD